MASNAPPEGPLGSTAKLTYPPPRLEFDILPAEPVYLPAGCLARNWYCPVV